MTERESETVENIASNFRLKIYNELRSSREFRDIQKYETELIYDKAGRFISLELKDCVLGKESVKKQNIISTH